MRCGFTATQSMPLLAHRVHVIVHAAFPRNVLTDPHAMQPVQPQIARMAGIEARRNPNLSRGWQIRAEKLLVAILAKVDCTGIRCQNERTVVSLQSHASIEQRNTVFAYGYPVAADGAQLPANPWPVNLAARIVEIHPKAFCQRPDGLRDGAASTCKRKNVLQAVADQSPLLNRNSCHR